MDTKLLGFVIYTVHIAVTVVNQNYGSSATWLMMETITIDCCGNLLEKDNMED
jgi:hypothetical protein